MKRAHYNLLSILAPEVSAGEHRWLVNQIDYNRIKIIMRDENIKWFLIGIVAGVFLLLFSAALLEVLR